MEHVFWIYPGQLAGRSGPGFAPWDLASLKAGGFDLLLSLATDLFPHTEVVEAGMHRVCIPFPDVLPPASDTVGLCRLNRQIAHSTLCRNIEMGRVILIHCAGGHDRTGLVLARYIAQRERMSAVDAIRRLRSIRPYALSAQGWEAMAVELIDEALS